MGDDFLDTTPEVQSMKGKMDTLDITEMKNLEKRIYKWQIWWMTIIQNMQK